MPVKANSTVGAEVNLYSKNWSSQKWVAKSQILTKLKKSNRFGFLYAKHNSEKNIRGVDEVFVFLVHPNVQFTYLHL